MNPTPPVILAPSQAGEAELRIEIPCAGLDPDTDPCPYCGAAINDPCAVEWGGTGAWRVSPDDETEVQQWRANAWASDCWTATAAQAAKWIADNIREMRDAE